MKLYKIGLVVAMSAMAVMTGCKKSYLDTRPSDQVPLTDAFKTTIGCKAAIQGMNRLMFDVGGDHDEFGEPSIMLMEDLMGNDMPMASRGSGWFTGTYAYTDHRQPTSTPAYTWGFYYRIISNANQLLDHIDAASGEQADKDFIKGQALFYRAYCLYKLSIYYQFSYFGNEDKKGVPIYTTASKTGSPRGTMQQTYAQIVKDLDDALLLLPNGTRVDRTDPDLSVAKGLYAGVALVMHNWTKAAQMASEARASYNLMSREQLVTGFNDISNSEWMWGCSINAEQNGIYASFLSEMVVAANGYAFSAQKLGFKYLCDSLQKGTPDDVRKDWWYTSAGAPGYKRYSQRKYAVKKAGSWINDIPFMRASEMALIEAEAKAEANDLPGAKLALESLIKIRRPSFVAPSDRLALLREIIFQRRIELWGEGFAFSDIKRYMELAWLTDAEKGMNRTAPVGGTNHDAQIAQLMSLPADDPRFLFRLPTAELNTNSSMTGADQNP